MACEPLAHDRGGKSHHGGASIDPLNDLQCRRVPGTIGGEAFSEGFDGFVLITLIGHGTRRLCGPEAYAISAEI